jgi:hypothetical protein
MHNNLSYSFFYNHHGWLEQKKPLGERWSEEKAWQWFEENDWLVGANYNPYNTINQLKMWQGETFDPDRIDMALGLAKMNCGFTIFSSPMVLSIHRKRWNSSDN